MKKNKIILVLCIGLLSVASSCNFLNDSPEKVFDTIGLNANKISRSFARNFKELRQHKENGTMQIPSADNKSMKPASCVAYLNYVYGKTFDGDIQNVKNLKATDETRPIINAALDMFRYADQVYKKDFVSIAKMIDEGKNDLEIDAAIKELDDTKGVELDKKYKATMDLLLPYADKHHVEYKTINLD